LYLESLPHAIVAARNPEISISSFFEYLCGMLIGSRSMKEGRLYKFLTS
jgi:hypothetical protein